MLPPSAIFNIQLALGYAPWLICFAVYGWPRLKAMSLVEAQRAIAVLHSFRVFGLVFILPGVVGPALPEPFAVTAAWGDFATGVLAILALLAFRTRPLFWALVVAFNAVGALDIVTDYINGVRLDLPAQAGQLSAAYAIVIVYVPLLMITHVAAFILLARRPAARAGAETAGA